MVWLWCGCETTTPQQPERTTGTRFDLRCVVSVLLLCVFMVGVALVWFAGRQQARAGLPPGRVISIDIERLDRVTLPLHDPSTNLVGKPDYLVRDGEGIIPVEVKSGKSGTAPYPSHTLQLAAYCRLVEASYGKRPRYGIVKYADRALAVEYSESLQNRLLALIAEMRQLEGRAPDRTHQSPGRCRACGYRQVCDQRLN